MTAKTVELGSMPAQIKMPYTLTPGTATSVFLGELAKRRLIGSRHEEEIIFPATEYSPTGVPSSGYVELAPVGELLGFTSDGEQLLGLVRVDGTSTPLMHRLVGFEGEPQIGARVQARWSQNPSGDSILDLEGFEPHSDANSFEPRENPEDLASIIEQVDYTMTLDFEHSYGHYYGTLFDGVKDGRRIRGVRCTECDRVLVPPRPRCDACFAETGQWQDLPSTGTVQASSVVHIEFIGQRVPPPYVYAEIILDGASTRLIHMVGGVDAESAKTLAAPGARVRAVWSDRHTGSLADIEYFELI